MSRRTPDSPSDLVGSPTPEEAANEQRAEEERTGPASDPMAAGTPEPLPTIAATVPDPDPNLVAPGEEGAPIVNDADTEQITESDVDGLIETVQAAEPEDDVADEKAALASAEAAIYGSNTNTDDPIAAAIVARGVPYEVGANEGIDTGGALGYNVNAESDRDG